MAGNSEDYRITPELVRNVQEAGCELLAMGRNPIFVREHSSGKSDWEVCAAMINEAKKIVAMGHNAKFGCSDLALLREAGYAQKHRDREKGGSGDDERREG